MSDKAQTIAPILIRISEAAVYLAVSERTIWTLVKSGKLPAVRFGKISRIAIADIDNFIAVAKGAC